MSQDYLLIVDDHAGVRHLLNELLVQEGYFVKTAKSGEECLQKVLAKKPLLIILDIKMPGKGGLETLDQLNTLCPHTPVIMITAYSDLPKINDALSHGLIKYCLNKPFDLEELRTLVKTLIERPTLQDHNLNSLEQS
ncbi:MAG: response regulator [Desulfitobacteriaceae bacterium]